MVDEPDFVTDCRARLAELVCDPLSTEQHIINAYDAGFANGLEASRAREAKLRKALEYIRDDREIRDDLLRNIARSALETEE